MNRTLSVLILGLAACAPDGVEPAARTSAPVDPSGAAPRQLRGPFEVAAPGEAGARELLARHAASLGLRADGGDLELVATRHGRAGSYLRFEQRADGLPVFGGELVVAMDGARVREVRLAHHRDVVTPDLGVDVGGDAALAAARAHVGAAADRLPPEVIAGVDAARGALAYRVRISTEAPLADWEVLVDAATGEVSGARDRLQAVDGDGIVFDMSPSASSGDTGLTDAGNSADGFSGEEFRVTLPRLDDTGVLRGQWVDVRVGAGRTRAQSAQLTFEFDRSLAGFEEVMAYYHLDRAQARIQELGFDDVNNRVQVVIANGITDDNSFYSPADQRLTFGTGGVDDAEDADIILHEYGHSIQDDQVPGFGGAGDTGAMGEGFGDYLAAAFSTVLPSAAGHAQRLEPACIGDWDAVEYSDESPPCLRRADRDKHFPEDFVDQIHTDGEIWSSALFAAREAIGGDAMDAVVLESHFMLTPSASFEVAAAALLEAEQALHGGEFQDTLRRTLTWYGVHRTPEAEASYGEILASEPVEITDPGGDDDYPANADELETYTRAGALALRVRFAELDTEGTGSDCAPGLPCDAIYLYDGDGDLHQILHGTQRNVTSVQVPGDTLQIRFVSGPRGQRGGYRIDVVEELGGEIVPPGEGPGPIAADDEGGGCGCRSGGDAAPLAAGLVLLGLVGRRRRQRRA